MTEWISNDLAGKLLLALVGAILSWAIKALWDSHQQRRRWKRLTPLLVRQLRSAAEQATTSFDASSLSHLERAMAAIHGHGVTMIETGFMVDAWLEGLSRLTDCLDAIRLGIAATDVDRRIAALDRVRKTARPVLDWTRAMEAIESTGDSHREPGVIAP